MANRLDLQHYLGPVPATVLAPKPGDFPVGSIQSRAAARALVANHAAEQAQDLAAEFGNLTPYEAATIEGVEEPGVARVALHMARVAEERAEIWGTRLGTPEEIRHLKKVAKLAGEITGMTLSQRVCLSNADSIEWNRIRALAEDVLRGKRAMTDKEIVAVREKYSEE